MICLYTEEYFFLVIDWVILLWVIFFRERIDASVIGQRYSSCITRSHTDRKPPPPQKKSQTFNSRDEMIKIL